MTNDDQLLSITDGMDVDGSNGEKVGPVAGVRGVYVVISEGFFPTDVCAFG